MRRILKRLILGVLAMKDLLENESAVCSHLRGGIPKFQSLALSADPLRRKLGIKNV